LASFGMAAIPLNAFRAILSSYFPQYTRSTVLRSLHIWSVILLMAGAALAVWFVWTHLRLVVKTVIVVLVCLSPLCVLTFSQAILAAVRYHGQPFRDYALVP